MFSLPGGRQIRVFFPGVSTPSVGWAWSQLSFYVFFRLLLKVSTTYIIGNKVRGKEKKVGEKLEHGVKERKMIEIDINRLSGPKDQGYLERLFGNSSKIQNYKTYRISINLRHHYQWGLFFFLLCSFKYFALYI